MVEMVIRSSCFPYRHWDVQPGYAPVSSYLLLRRGLKLVWITSDFICCPSMRLKKKE